MRLWILIVLACVVQESASTNAVLLSAYQHQYPLWIVHCLFALGTMLDITLAYFAGRLICQKFPNSSIILYVQKVAHDLGAVLGTRGQRLGIFFLGIINFIYIDAFVFAWFPFSFWEIALLLFLGDMCAYAIEWVFVLGVNHFFPDPLSGLEVIIAVSFAIIVVSRLLFKGSSTKV